MRRAVPFALAALTVAAALVGLLAGTPGVLAAGRLMILVAAGLALGSLTLVAVGRLLANEWRTAVEDELLPAAWLLPAIAMLAVPLLAQPTPAPQAIIGAGATVTQLAWFASEARVARLGVCLVAWLAALLLVTRSRAAPASAAALLLATIATLVAAVDWLLLTTPFWWSRLLPFAILTSQVSGALAFAFLVDAAMDEQAGDGPFASLSSGLLGLALLTLWTWFAQFLTAWSVNLPVEARWYVVRDQGPGWWLLAGATALTLAAILALIVLPRRRIVLGSASVAILAAYGLHSAWWYRPTALAPFGPKELAAVLPAAAILAGWYWWLIGTRLGRVAEARHADPDPNQR